MRPEDFPKRCERPEHIRQEAALAGYSIQGYALMYNIELIYDEDEANDETERY